MQRHPIDTVFIASGPDFTNLNSEPNTTAETAKEKALRYLGDDLFRKLTDAVPALIQTGITANDRQEAIKRAIASGAATKEQIYSFIDALAIHGGFEPIDITRAGIYA